MPMFHVTVEVEIGGQVVTVQQVVDMKSSGDTGNVKVDIQRLMQTGETRALADRRQYVGKIDKMDLTLGDVPVTKTPPPMTDRRGAIKAQKERHGS